MICAVFPSIGIQAVMLPVSEAKMKFALADAPTGGVTKKSVNGLETVPVGSPLGIVIVCGLALSTTGAPATSPRTSCVVLVPLLAIQNGLLAVAEIPQGLTRSGSRTGARPGMSEIKFVCR